MPHLTFIHGILNKPPEEELLEIWRRSLEESAGIDLEEAGITTSLIYWADVMYPEPVDQDEGLEGLGAGDIPRMSDEAVEWRGDISGEGSDFVERLSGRLGLGTEVPSDEPPAGEADVDLERFPLPRAFKRLVMEAFLRDVHHYLFNVEHSPRPGEVFQVQDEIRRRTVEALVRDSDANAGKGPHVVVSHSMGTVIAYDCLKRVPECPAVDGLMTIGSPLGIDEVQDSLTPSWTREDGFPSEKLRGSWTNVYDRLDPVALDPTLADDYQSDSERIVIDKRVRNSGRWRHGIQKYLARSELRSLLALQAGIRWTARRVLSDTDAEARLELEKMTEPFVDDDYDSRTGYDPDFLGVSVPIPTVADLSVVAELEDGSGHVIPYEHFSVVLHRDRRLALFTASNLDGNEDRKEPEPGRNYTRRGLSGLGKNDREKWVLDPRLDSAVQLPDKFYTRDRGNFDKGHIVRRDDVAWGADFDEVRRANGDTYHVTNCSPQVDAFNRSNLRGEWGKLENFILKQAETERLCVFAGPILDDENDLMFSGRDDDGPVEVQIPSKFWKVVGAQVDGKLQTFAFLLDQDLTGSEVEFNVTAEWESRMISLPDLENLLPDLVFADAVRQGDQFAELPAASLSEETGLERHPKSASVDGDTTLEPEDSEMTNGQLEWDDETSPGAVDEGLQKGDHARVGALLDALAQDLDSTGRLMDAKAAKKTLAALRKYAWFEKLRFVSEKLDEHAQDDPAVLLQLAQARIELGEITSAVGLLLKLSERIEEELQLEGLTPPEREGLEYNLGEALGLLGRAYKQYYVDAGPSAAEPRSADLEKSLEYYGQGFERRLGDYMWHGINYVALLTHKERVARGRANAISRDAKRRAEQLLEAIDEKEHAGPLPPWDLANRIEANLAIGDTPAAVEATMAYLDAADVFAVQSTRRQLTEVWGLTEDQPPGDDILPLMHARFAELGGAAQAVELHPAMAVEYQRVWGSTGYRSLDWLNKALERANSVARIGPSKYDGDGTGFLIDGAWISEEYVGKPLMLTNAHVCSDDPAVLNQYPYPSPPEELTAVFLGEGGANAASELRFVEVLWTSPPAELDATLLLLEGVPDGCAPPPKTSRTPPVTLKGDSRLNILGHPKGLDLRISLQDNETVEVGSRYVRYRTPTDPGSSGSPVFNQKWDLVALHHASSSAKKANEGIRIDVILEAVKEKLA